MRRDQTDQPSKFGALKTSIYFDSSCGSVGLPVLPQFGLAHCARLANTYPHPSIQSSPVQCSVTTGDLESRTTMNASARVGIIVAAAVAVMLIDAVLGREGPSSGGDSESE